MAVRRVSIHGHAVTFESAGSGPVVVLVHGMAGSSETWRRVVPLLAREATVIAPDLPGHGASERVGGDATLGTYASCLRDLLLMLGHDRATVVGQSLGGGVAMQFAYQFPERCERLGLVGSGGLGQEVHVLLRALALPGSEYLLSLGCASAVRNVGTSISALLGRTGFVPSPELEEIARAYSFLGDGHARRAFLDTLRAVVDVSGQRVDARDRLYLASAIPTLLVWGDRDRIIPVEHAHAAHAAMPGSRLEIFEGAGHFPHCHAPERFASVLLDFIRTTAPAALSPNGLHDALRHSGPIASGAG
ncbi:MAG: alpha/beta fold hydrolase [Actinobacteria bacterium]|nr:alpha/beta fold hydrolase [Actinomycetota bacterium]